ncbi:hypothetical protein niasHT_037861 [Heterodera trifolii]|uniref:Uncharacterized protein n=1 Tax=Heterodera trifolii TaxID=157864 RepID=A0ABD2J164_9BILA
MGGGHTEARPSAPGRLAIGNVNGEKDQRAGPGWNGTPPPHIDESSFCRRWPYQSVGTRAGRNLLEHQQHIEKLATIGPDDGRTRTYEYVGMKLVD